MTKITITYGRRATDKVTIEVMDITDLSEIYNAVQKLTGLHSIAYACVAALNEGHFVLA